MFEKNEEDRGVRSAAKKERGKRLNKVKSVNFDENGHDSANH